MRVSTFRICARLYRHFETSSCVVQLAPFASKLIECVLLGQGLARQTAPR